MSRDVETYNELWGAFAVIARAVVYAACGFAAGEVAGAVTGLSAEDSVLLASALATIGVGTGTWQGMLREEREMNRVAGVY